MSAPLVVVGWRWCPSKQDIAEWEDGNGCLWCEDDRPHARLLIETQERAGASGGC